VKGQTEQVLKKIDDLLKAAGTDKSAPLRHDLSRRHPGLRRDERRGTPGWSPAARWRATVEARLANSEFLVEIVAIAAV
jgi:enamine deaminase RidA (YjgF/YER057c/UK114 family)